LRVIEMTMPPLREHREDIEALVQHFVRQFALKFHKPDMNVSRAAMDAMTGYDWPGNVRELKNAIERAVILEDGRELRTNYLPSQLTRAPVLAPAGDASFGFTLPPGGVTLERVEESLVRQAMEMASGNQTRAAQLLGLSRDALRYKLKKFNVES
jgi:DNA-binding NtrC family response regulator